MREKFGNFLIKDCITILLVEKKKKNLRTSKNIYNFNYKSSLSKIPPFALIQALRRRGN